MRAALREVPIRSDDAALLALRQLGVADDERVTYLQAHLTRLPGWAAHVRWSAERATGADLLDYLAMRLAYESVLLSENGSPQGGTGGGAYSPMPSARERAAALAQAWELSDVKDSDLGAAARVLSALPVTARPMVWQQAYEGNYCDALLRSLTQRTPEPSNVRPYAQLVCCIDTRSEGLRRHIESLGAYQTFGFAGFFAIAIRFTGLLGGAPNDLCPVLISPEHEVAEIPAPSAAAAARRQYDDGRRRGGPPCRQAGAARTVRIG